MDRVAATQPRPFHSILFQNAETGARCDAPQTPCCFHDLQLDRIVQAVVSDYAQYDLAPYFYAPLNDPDEIAYRQEIMRDLEDGAAMQAVSSFAQQMRDMRERLAQKLYYPREKARWFLGAVMVYGDAVVELEQELRRRAPASRGLRSFLAWLTDYVGSTAFKALMADAASTQDGLAAIRYALFIKDGSVTVRHCDNELDVSAAVAQTFAKFRRSAAKDYRASFRHRPGIDHVQAQILDRVALLFPQAFDQLDAFVAAHANYLDDTVAQFDRQVQFYVAWLAYLQPLRQRGLAFCYPTVSATDKEVSARNVFDLALATQLLDEHADIVCNDFFLRDPERVFVVSGPNQGGKTTFARTFGQLHWLGCLGCPVPGSEARLFLFDHLLTHFEKEEDITNLRGKLKDDLVRIHRVLEQATPRSIVVMNEIFSSTTPDDAVYLGSKVMARISRLDLLAVCVTFLVELASFDDKTVSVTSRIDPADPAVRTYKVERKPADGLAYALAIAEKYRTTYRWLKERITP